MDLIYEIILEIIFEGTLELSSNKKVPKFIRYPLIFILFLLISIIIVGIFILGISIYNENAIISLILLISSIALLNGAINKFKNLYLEKNKQKTNKP